MSKTTKIIAALGVVAGLGVAALPGAVFADQTQQSVSGDVDLYVEVQPAIAMTITGNNDDGSYYNKGTAIEYTAVTPQEGDNPQALGWYELDDSNYVLTTDTSVESGKTYYARSGSEFATVKVKNPGSVQSINGVDVSNFEVGVATKPSSTYTSLYPSSVVEGGTFKSDITVYTNSTTGYVLSVIDKDASASLTQILPSGSSAVADTIPVTASTTLTPGTAAWGYRVGTTGDWLAMPVSTAGAATIKTTSAKTSGGDATVVEYGVATKGDQATGIYTDTITYTATTH